MKMGAAVMDLSEYMLETIRKDGEFILYRGQHADCRRESSVHSRDGTCLGTPRTGKPQENGARILLQGRARSRLGCSASTLAPAHRGGRCSYSPTLAASLSIGCSEDRWN